LSRKGGGTLFLNTQKSYILETFKAYKIRTIELENGREKLFIPKLNLTIYQVENWEGLDIAAKDMAEANYDPFNYLLQFTGKKEEK
jgi:hypothetical protein